MGEIIRDVQVRAIANGKPGRVFVIPALIDSGASRSVISEDAAKDIGARIDRDRVHLDDFPTLYSTTNRTRPFAIGFALVLAVSAAIAE